MEQLIAEPKKRGRKPSLQSSAEPETDKLKKVYIFQLLQTHENQKPRDGKTGEMVNSPYQPFFAEVNSGVAWDSEYKAKGSKTEGAQRRWRYLYNYPTIWVDEQIDPEPTKEDLAAPENDIVFRNGVLRVFGHEEMKLKALMLNNAFKGCVRPLKNVPARYELLDQDKIDKEVLAHLDDAFEAEKAAREASVNEMYALAYFYGIDLGLSDEAIRKQFITKARQNPTVFNREFVNPRNKYKYVFASAFADNMISSTKVPGQVVFSDTMAKACDLNTDAPIEELTSRCFADENRIKELYNRLSKEYL